jgi:hypothetical protein
MSGLVVQASGLQVEGTVESLELKRHRLCLSHFGRSERGFDNKDNRYI